MTVLDTSTKLYQWFSDNEIFRISRNFKDIFLISEDEEADLASLKCALDCLEDAKIIKSTKIDDEKIYVLNQKLDSIDMSVDLDYNVAHKVASCVNQFCERIDDYTDISDPSNITKKDILNLTLIVDYFYDKEKND